MIIKITGLERGRRKTKKGDPQDGIYFTGIKYKDGNPDGNYEKFFADYFDGEIIAVLEQIGVGGMADIKLEKSGQYWNAVSAKPAGGTTVPKKAVETEPKSSNPAPKSVPNKETSEPLDMSYVRDAALERATELIKSAVMLNAQDKTGLLPKSKMTLDLLAQEVLRVAGMFEKYLGGETEGEPKADTKALTEGAGEEPIMIRDEDIPF